MAVFVGLELLGTCACVISKPGVDADTKCWMPAHLGTAGGSATSPAKAAAARVRGAKGGRPKKQE